MVQRPEDQSMGVVRIGTDDGGGSQQSMTESPPSFRSTFRKLKRMVDKNGDMSTYPIHYRFQVLTTPVESSSSDPSDLCCLIKEAGGELCSDKDGGSKEYALRILDVVALADCPHHDFDVPNDTYSSAFIYASIENQMKKLAHPDPKIFLLTPSIYASYDPLQILLRNKKWSDLTAVSEPTTNSSKDVIESFKLHKSSLEQRQQQISKDSSRPSSNHVVSVGSGTAKPSGAGNLTDLADSNNRSQTSEEFISLTQSQQGKASEMSSKKKIRQEVVEERRSVRSPSVHMVPASPPLTNSTRKRRKNNLPVTVEVYPERQMRSPSKGIGKNREHATSSKSSSKKAKESERSPSPAALDQDRDPANSSGSPEQAMRRSPRRTKGLSQKEPSASSSKNTGPLNSSKSTTSSVHSPRRIFTKRVPQ